MEIEKGKLSTSREWRLILSESSDHNLKEGKHFILEVVGQLTPAELTLQELNELRLLVFKLAEQLATETGRWRVDFNGPAVATAKHWHAHIKLPAGKDKLERLVG